MNNPTTMTIPLMTALPCTVHLRHSPHSHINHRHHVWPLGRGGPDTRDNTVVVCPTGHANIHRLLDFLILEDGKVPWHIARSFMIGERRIARLGYERIVRNAM